MKIFKENLSKKQKVVATLSLLFVCFCVIALMVEGFEVRSVELAEQRLHEAYDNYESLVKKDLSEIEVMGTNVVKLAYSGNTESFAINQNLLSKCDEFLNELGSHGESEATIDELHQDVLLAVQRIKEGSELWISTLGIVTVNQNVTQVDLDNQSKAMELIAWGVNSIRSLKSQIQYKSY